MSTRSMMGESLLPRESTGWNVTQTIDVLEKFDTEIFTILYFLHLIVSKVVKRNYSNDNVLYDVLIIVIR